MGHIKERLQRLKLEAAKTVDVIRFSDLAKYPDEVVHGALNVSQGDLVTVPMVRSWYQEGTLDMHIRNVPGFLEDTFSQFKYFVRELKVMDSNISEAADVLNAFAFCPLIPEIGARRGNTILESFDAVLEHTRRLHDARTGTNPGTDPKIFAVALNRLADKQVVNVRPGHRNGPIFYLSHRNDPAWLKEEETKF